MVRWRGVLARLLIVWFGLAWPARAAEVVVVEGFARTSIGRTLEVAYDATGLRTVEDVVAGALPFTATTKDVPSFGFRGGAEWARVRIADRRGLPGELVIEHGYGPTDLVEVFEVDAGRVVRRAKGGDHVPPEAWDVLARNAAFTLAPRADRELYVRVETTSSHQLPFTLFSARAYEAHRREDLVVQCLYFGALGAMLLYNALVWAATRSRSYAYYVGFLGSFGGLQLAFLGFLPPLLGVVGWAADVPFALMVTGAITFGGLFANHILDLPAHSPRLARLSRATVIAGLVTIPPALAIGVRVGTELALLESLSNCIIVIGFGVAAHRAGSAAARWYLTAWTALLLGSVVIAMKTFGVLPTNAFTSNAMQVGSVLEFLLLSFALADRIKRLQAEATRNAERAREATERVLVEHERTNAELERLGKLKDEFLANTSHELRTPLHGILGLTESVLSAEPGLGAASRKRLGMVVASGRRLASLVNDILDFSKLRNQELALRERAIELRSAVDMTLSVLAPGADAKGLALVNEVEAGLVVQADEGRLQQILTNLVGNAVKFTSSGSVVVRAEETSGDAGGRVVVSVRDTGIGIAPEAHARIFESFEQADGSTSRAFGGTGLGLAVTKKLVELHGGRVALRSAPGRGSTFSFDVARAEGAPGAGRVHGRDESGGESMLLRAAPPEGSDDASVGFPSVSALAASGPATGHLLVADDDPVNLEVLRAQLEPGGYSVTIARDGAEAVAALETLPQVDGVLLDVMMPNMTGVEAAVRMREAHPHGTLPILMLTAKSRPEDAVVGLRAGASDYVGKPFHREELLRRVDAHVRALKTARTFRRFVPEDFLALLGVEGFDALRAGLGERREVTILFSDVRAFTARSERLGPERTFRFINACLERFEPVVRRHGGFVDKFIGDAIMAIFPGEGRSAVHAAAELHRSIDGFEASFPEDAAPVAIGVGVHRGPVILGTIGAANRMEVTAIGDAVNVAARLESLTKSLGAGALVSKEVLDGEPHDARRVGAVHVKGRAAAVELFELLACCSSDQEREQKRGMNVRFQRGLLAYAERDMARARETFASCVKDAPLDRTAALYLERSTEYAERGVPEGFDGCLDGV